MRFFFSLIIVSGIAAGLAGCGEGAATKADKSSEISGRQEVTLRLAHATEGAGDYAGAEKMFLQVVSQSPATVEPRVELAEFYRRHHEDQKAIESLNAGLKIQPKNTDVARELANTYIGAAEPEKALALLDTAIAANGRDPLLYNSQGVALDEIGSYELAQKSYRKAYDLDPAQGMMYKVNISMSYILSGSYDKAIALLRPMLDTPDAAPPIVRQNLALAYGLKGESENALKLGLQDLSESEAAENVRFYRMLALRHNAGREKQTGTSAVPASVVQDLFPEKEPAPAMATPGGAISPQSEAMPLSQPKTLSAQEDIPPPAVRSMSAVESQHQPLATMEPSSGADSPPASTTSTDDTLLPEPILKPDRY